MSRRRRPMTWFLLFGVVAVAGPAFSGTWSTEAQVGATAEYTTNPGLAPAGSRAEQTAAALIDLPLTYSSDTDTLRLHPRLRFANTRGYDSLNSDYRIFDADWEHRTERTTLRVAAGVTQDSTAFNRDLSAEILRVSTQRDAENASVSWERELSQRSGLGLEFAWQRVRYPDSATLTDFRYMSTAVNYVWWASERLRLQLYGFGGRYASLDDRIRSSNLGLQFGMAADLSRLWSTSVGIGLSKLRNEQDIYLFDTFYFGTLESTQTGTVYRASLDRKGLRSGLSASLSRSLQPSGIGTLQRADEARLDASYRFTQRVALSGGLGALSSRAASTSGDVDERRRYTGRATVEYRLSEQWQMNLTAAHVRERFLQTDSNADSNQFVLELRREFLRTPLR